MFVIKAIKRNTTYVVMGCLLGLVGCSAPVTKPESKTKKVAVTKDATQKKRVVKKVTVVKKVVPVKKPAPQRLTKEQLLQKKKQQLAQIKAKKAVARAEWQRKKDAQRHQQMVEYRRAAYRRNATDGAKRLSNAAIGRLRHHVRYDGRYIPIGYPNGDVPANIGVCTDTVIRSYRRLGIDLQRDVYEDISRNFHAYPNLPKWQLTGPDPNIDHRRVHNLKVFFTRRGRRLPVTNNPADYKPGDLVTWDLRNGGQNHIGIVVDRRSPTDPRRYMVVHNIGEGERMEDILFTMPITGHYRYFPSSRNTHLAYR